MHNKVICDTGVVSDFLGGDTEKIAVFEKIGLENILITDVIRMELNKWLGEYKNLDKKKRALFKKFIRNTAILYINTNIAKKAVEINDKYENTAPADTLIIATALHYNLKVYTNNQKHFKKFGVLYS